VRDVLVKLSGQAGSLRLSFTRENIPLCRLLTSCPSAR
jgi:hypothetical protein